MTNWNTIKDGPGKKTSELMEESKSLFLMYTWRDFKEFDKDFPAPAETTTRTFAPNVEADEKHKNKSYDDLEKEGVQGITLRERLIMELQYFKETGKNLDIENATLCTGSIFWVLGGLRVPHVDWDDGKPYVGWSFRDSGYGIMSSREVIEQIESAVSVFPVDLKIPEGISKHCLGLHCPERKSVCCNKPSRTSTSVEQAFGIPKYHCTGEGCGKEFVGGECTAQSDVSRPSTPDWHKTFSLFHDDNEAGGSSRWMVTPDTVRVFIEGLLASTTREVGARVKKETLKWVLELGGHDAHATEQILAGLSKNQ